MPFWQTTTRPFNWSASTRGHDWQLLFSDLCVVPWDTAMNPWGTVESFKFSKETVKQVFLEYFFWPWCTMKNKRRAQWTGKVGHLRLSSIGSASTSTGVLLKEPPQMIKSVVRHSRPSEHNQNCAPNVHRGQGNHAVHGNDIIICKASPALRMPSNCTISLPISTTPIKQNKTKLEVIFFCHIRHSKAREAMLGPALNQMHKLWIIRHHLLLVKMSDGNMMLAFMYKSCHVNVPCSDFYFPLQLFVTVITWNTRALFFIALWLFPLQSQGIAPFSCQSLLMLQRLPRTAVYKRLGNN